MAFFNPTLLNRNARFFFLSFAIIKILCFSQDKSYFKNYEINHQSHIKLIHILSIRCNFDMEVKDSLNIFRQMSVFNDLLSLFFPQICAGCSSPLVKGEDILCLNCLADLPKNNFRDGKENPFALTFLGRVNICYAISYYSFDKGGKVQHILHQLKYKGRKDIGYKLGLMFGNELIKSTHFGEIDAIIPVPLHPRKQRSRGYNQSIEICNGISKSMNRPLISGNLVRQVFTSSQTMKGRYERWENVSGIFRVKNSLALSGKHLLLVDDIVTTGATMEACRQPLLEIPGVKVSIAALASV